MRTPGFVNRAGLLTLIAALLAMAGMVHAERFDDSAVRHIAYPNWFEDSPFNDLEEALAAARAAGKQGLLVLFTTEGCSYCEAFIRKSLGDPLLAARVQRQFAAVGLEIFDDAEMTTPRGESMPVKRFAADNGVQFSPTLVFVDTDGETLLRVVGYQSPERFGAILDYVAGGHHRTASLREYLARRSGDAPAPAAGEWREDPLFGGPPYQLDRSRFAAERPLLVLFDARGCAACAEFHQGVIADPEVRAALRDFEVVRLDAADDRTAVLAPDGLRVTPASWFERTGFTAAPALLFFDERGREVLKTDALVLRQRMLNALAYVRERAYDKDWTFQRFARVKGLERLRDAAQPATPSAETGAPPPQVTGGQAPGAGAQ